MAFGRTPALAKIVGSRELQAPPFRLIIAILQWNKRVLERSRAFGGTRQKMRWARVEHAGVP
jgi:hypothetical protein